MKTNCSDCCYPQLINPEACGCCECVEIITPLSIYNRPGLSEISYRIGTHASFLETMTARLTGYYLEKTDAESNPQKIYPLQGLTTRNSDDPVLAMLDAWATVADVLTFYQERIANEGYLRTATERRSVLELARLVGYKPRPGVSSSVFLAYTLDENFKEETVIPAGSPSQSIPGPDELPQSFETSEDLKARAQWNNLKPRVTQPQTQQSIENEVEVTTTADNGETTITTELRPRVYLKGISTNIKPHDAIQIEFAENDPQFFFANEILPDAEADYTLVTFSVQPAPVFQFIPIVKIIQNLSLSASVQPANRLQLNQNLIGQFALQFNNIDSSIGSEPFPSNGSNFMPVAQAGYSVLGAVSSVLSDKLTKIVANNKITDTKIECYLLGIKANLFGHNLPLPIDRNCSPSGAPGIPPVIVLAVVSDSDPEGLRTLALDAEYADIKVGDRVVIKKKNNSVVFSKVVSIDSQTLGGPQQNNGLMFFSTCPTMSSITTSGVTTVTETEPIKIKVTVLTLDSNWREESETDNNLILKTTTVYIQSSHPQLAEEPISIPIGNCTNDNKNIELDSFYDGLVAGSWVIVSGERDDLSGVKFSELAMLSSVTQGLGEEKQTVDSKSNFLPGETPHTFIKFAEKLAYCFKRDTVNIYGNVVKATHGKTLHQVLGSGNGAKPFQSFELKQFPLTHVSASNPTGVDSTLKLYVNDLQWHEADSLAGLEANDRQFISKTNNEDNTTVIFGNGKKGARLPTGIENIRAEYRNGIGKPGNVKAEQISLLMDKPLGVKEVINPLQASGGANRETRDQARKHVPLAVKALDRLVSIQDYEDFSRIYAGIGKAHAVELSNGRQQLVHVTIAGAEDIPIEQSSDLFRNLRRALHDFGDPHQAIQLAIRELMFIVIEAGVVILPDYQWESVVTDLRERLLDSFSFEQRELGQDVMLSEMIHVMQSVRGVAYVDVDSFGGIPEKIENADGNRRLLTPEEIAEAVACLATRWSHVDMEAFCANNSDTSGPDFDECNKFESCQKYGHFGGTRGVRQRLQVNLAKFEKNRVIRPAQIAFLTPDVPATLILNQIKSLP